MHSIKDIVKQLIGKSLDAYNTNYTKVVNTRIDNIVAQAGNDNTEIVDARIDSAGVSHTTLNNRILAETKMTDEKLIEYSGSSLSVEDTMPGYLQNIEIKGNTIQNEDNLADIRSVGNKIEGQELYEIPVLSVGKNLFNPNIFENEFLENQRIGSHGGPYSSEGYTMLKRLKEIPKFWFNKTLVHNFVGCIAFYSATDDGSLISRCYQDKTYAIPQNAKYFRFEYQKYKKDEFQLEEGTVATQYEPYQEDKLTILSPVQLERVGDVADRIVCKDGVWGVEKNIARISLDSTLPWSGYKKETNLYSAHLNLQNVKGFETFQHGTYDIMLSNLKFKHHATGIWGTTEEIITNYDNKYIMIFLDNVDTFDKWKQKLNDYNTVVYLIRKTPQFIPLPHDQQVKLHTFANKTNISFLTEIEGTIKAQVPKSLGATVNTHTEQINNLNKELDRVKKLEESTVSTVTTESDFTTVEATSNGYFEDVKLEGKTLVNLAPKYSIKWTHSGTWLSTLLIGRNNANNAYPRVLQDLKPNTEYTVIVNIKTNTQSGNIDLNNYQNDTCVFNDNMFIKPSDIGIKTFKVKTVESFDNINPSYMVILRSQSWSIASGETLIEDIMILEGDHTQNPPSYFEGLKSVGQSATTSEDGVDEISVESIKGDGNLVEYIELNGVIVEDGKDYTDNKYVRTNYITVKPNQTYYIKPSTNILYNKYSVYFYDSNKSFLGYRGGLTSEFTTVANTKFIRIDMKKADNTGNTQEDINNCDFVVSKCRVSEYIPRQSDKKRLLYYNEETQTWEKTILREWDSIENHADGKYYYHQRSAEVVLNGSENWGIGNSSNDITLLMYAKPSEVPKSYTWGICDKFNFQTTNNESIGNTEYIYVDTDINIRVNKSKLSTQDIQGFKQWLQTNNVTVVYQLAQEKVYECTNMDLITYTNETNYIVSSGAVSPKTTLKVHNNISNVVSLLQKKVSLLESNMTKYMITQNRLQLSSTYSSDSVTFKVDYAVCSENMSQENYDTDLYNLILNNILVGKDNYNYDHMFNIIMDYASWSQISWDQFDILVGVMDSQHNPPIEEIPTDDEIVEEIPNEII